MLHHHITKYWDDDGLLWCEASLQLNVFGWCWCFSKRRKLIKEGSPEGEPES